MTTTQIVLSIMAGTAVIMIIACFFKPVRFPFKKLARPEATPDDTVTIDAHRVRRKLSDVSRNLLNES